jgi:hypothetical protein
MKKFRGANLKFATEAIWSNQEMAYDFQQQLLF